MATPLTNDKADEIIVALNAVTAELKECLKTAAPVAAPAAPGSGGGGGSVTSTALPLSPPPPSSTIKLNLLLKVADAAATDIEECRIVNTAPKDLPASRKGEFWFTHQVELTTNTGSGIALISGGTIAIGAVTFLKETGSADPDAQNTKEITIQQEFVDNIIKAIDDNTKGLIENVYLKYDATNNPPWSVVADDSEKDKTIQLVPDIVVGKGAVANKYIISFEYESNFADGKQIQLMDGKTGVTANADTITEINTGLETVKSIPIIKGGKRRRQTRRGGKRYRRKSRRFR